MKDIKTIRAEIKETRREMKTKGIKRISCFNGGLSGEVYSLNARMFALETSLKDAINQSTDLIAAGVDVARISCGGDRYMLPAKGHAGRNLRAFFGVEDDQDLWGENDKDDSLIPDDEAEILVEDGMKFHTANRKINN